MNKFSVCFILFAFLALAHTKSFESRIVGGANATEGQFPYKASLQAGGDHFCSGVIINNRWLLTVAHCVIGRSASTITARVRTITRLTGGATHVLSNIVVHPQYNANNLQNDIALCQTATTIAFNPSTQPTQLPTNNLGGGNGVVSGWGFTSTAGPLAPILQWKSVQIISNQECVNYHLTGGTAGMIVDEKICALSPGGMGSCTGDSGSSLTRDGLVYGLISWGVGCDSTLPDIYTRVFSYDSWITATAV